MSRASLPLFLLFFARCFAYQAPAAPAVNHLEDPFALGWMLVDTNGDGIADSINGKVVVPSSPSAFDNAAAANVAARLAYGSTGLTPPLVVAGDAPSGPSIEVRKDAAEGEFEKEEGVVSQSPRGLLISARDDAGITAAAEAYAARAPYIWRMNGEKLSAIAQAVGGGSELLAVTYLRGKAGIHRAFLRGNATQAALDAALAKPELASVHQLVVVDGPTATNPKPEAAAPTAPAPAADNAAAAPAAANAAPARLDLATLFTSRGLFGASGRIPVPGSSNGHLFVPAGAAGVAMANLAARMGLETTGITLPIASPADTAAARDVRAPAVLAGTFAARPRGRAQTPRQRHRRRAIGDRPRPRRR